MSPRSLLVISSLTLVAATAWAGPTRTYQVSGPVLEINDDVVVIQKGKEKLEIARNSETRVGRRFKAKVGDVVLVRYRMTAASLEARSEAAMSAAGPAEKKLDPTGK